MQSSRTHRAAARLAVTVLVLAAGVVTVHGSGTSNNQPPASMPRSGSEVEKQETSAYDRGMELAKSEQYAEARQIFEKLEAEDPDNAEVVNMLAYTQRKTGDLDKALVNYQRALKLRPKFPEAREYLGEAYLQAAMRELDTLRGYGNSGKEEMQKLADAFQEAAAQLEPTTSGGTKTKSSKW